MAEPTANLPTGDLEAAKRLGEATATLRREIHKVIVGQDRVIDELLTALFARGHCLLEGVPGLAKTLLIHTLARSLSLTFSRIQFTPDLMPSDITGTEVIEEDRATGTRSFRFVRGPVFANVILADEINRTPPKTQAALLEAMQEFQVTAAGQRHPLDPPFFVLATQNPIEQEGTYPLPEAQLDRFMFHIRVDYPTAEEEREVVRLTTAAAEADVAAALRGEEVLALQKLVRRVPIADHVLGYAIQLARLSRPKDAEAPEFVKQWVAWGAGPRASQYLTLAGKARALLHGRTYVSTDDIRAVAHPVLRHRVLVNFAAEAEGIHSEDIVDKLLDHVPAHSSDALQDERLPKVLGS